MNKLLNRVQDGMAFGWKKNPAVQISSLFDSQIFSQLRPVFFLSTGRCGTMLFTKLLNHEPHVKVYHEPIPTLSLQAKSAWEINVRSQVEKSDLLKDVFLAARELYLYKTARYGKRYIETNRNITFFAPIIKELIPTAQFVHVYRHPADFIRSGIRRGWYSGDHPHDAGRITPLPGDPYFDKWSDLSDVQKIAWLWESTNSFIDNFSDQMDSRQFFKLNFDEMGIDNVSKMVEFLGLTITRQKIDRTIQNPVNIQKSGNFPAYENWSSADRDALQKICRSRSEKYGFKL